MNLRLAVDNTATPEFIDPMQFINLPPEQRMQFVEGIRTRRDAAMSAYLRVKMERDAIRSATLQKKIDVQLRKMEKAFAALDKHLEVISIAVDHADILIMQKSQYESFDGDDE